jgi:hypothetical protein
VEYKRITQLIAIAKEVNQIVAVSQRSNCHLFKIAFTSLSNRYNLTYFF